MAEGMILLAGDSSLRGSISEQGRQSVWERHGPEEIYPRLLALYGKAIEMRKGRLSA